jgi:hypothetical protein
MTPYENAALAIAKQTYHTYLAADIIGFLALCASVLAGWFLFGQLKTARWTALLALEQDMASRRRHLTEIATTLAGSNPPPNIREIYEAEKESYLNSVDRLASSILNRNFPEKEMKQDYRDLISATVAQFPDDFRTGTTRWKTVELHQKWQR